MIKNTILIINVRRLDSWSAKIIVMRKNVSPLGRARGGYMIMIKVSNILLNTKLFSLLNRLIYRILF